MIFYQQSIDDAKIYFALVDYPEPPEGGTVLSPYHVCDLTALICLATIVADSSFPALQRLARLGLIQVSVVAATAMLVPRP